MSPASQLSFSKSSYSMIHGPFCFLIQPCGSLRSSTATWSAVERVQICNLLAPFALCNHLCHSTSRWTHQTSLTWRLTMSQPCSSSCSCRSSYSSSGGNKRMVLVGSSQNDLGEIEMPTNISMLFHKTSLKGQRLSRIPPCRRIMMTTSLVSSVWTTFTSMLTRTEVWLELIHLVN